MSYLIRHKLIAITWNIGSPENRKRTFDTLLREIPSLEEKPQGACYGAALAWILESPDYSNKQSILWLQNQHETNTNPVETAYLPQETLKRLKLFESRHTLTLKDLKSQSEPSPVSCLFMITTPDSTTAHTLALKEEDGLYKLFDAHQPHIISSPSYEHVIAELEENIEKHASHSPINLQKVFYKTVL